MHYPSESPDYLQSLQTSRINVVMKDAKDGAYLADQQMNTTRLSDQTEFNNALLVSCMLYDLIDLVHYNHFKFNEAEEVRQFDEAVNDCINEKYAENRGNPRHEDMGVAGVGRIQLLELVLGEGHSSAQQLMRRSMTASTRSTPGSLRLSALR